MARQIISEHFVALFKVSTSLEAFLVAIKIFLITPIARGGN